MHGAGQPPTVQTIDRITRLVGALADLKPLPAELKHFGHEGHLLQLTLLIQCAEDFLLGTNLNPFACTEVEMIDN